MPLKFNNIIAGKKYKRKTNNKIGEVTEIDKNSFSILFKGEADAEMQDKDDTADFELVNNSSSGLSSGSNGSSLPNIPVLEAEIRSLKMDLRNEKTKLSDLNEELSKLDTNKTSKESQISSINLLISTTQKTINTLKTTILNIHQLEMAKKEPILKITMDSAIKKIYEIELASINQEIFQKNQEKTLINENIARLKKAIESKRQESILKATQIDVNKLEKNYTNLDSKHKKLLEQKTQINNQISILTESITSKTEQMKTVNEKIKNEKKVNERTKLISESSKFKTEIGDLKDQLVLKTAKKKEIEIEIAEAERDLKIKEAELLTEGNKLRSISGGKYSTRRNQEKFFKNAPEHIKTKILENKSKVNNFKLKKRLYKNGNTKATTLNQLILEQKAIQNEEARQSYNLPRLVELHTQFLRLSREISNIVSIPNYKNHDRAGIKSAIEKKLTTNYNPKFTAYIPNATLINKSLELKAEIDKQTKIVSNINGLAIDSTNYERNLRQFETDAKTSQTEIERLFTEIAENRQARNNTVKAIQTLINANKAEIRKISYNPNVTNHIKQRGKSIKKLLANELGDKEKIKNLVTGGITNSIAYRTELDRILKKVQANSKSIQTHLKEYSKELDNEQEASRHVNNEKADYTAYMTLHSYTTLQNFVIERQQEIRLLRTLADKIKQKITDLKLDQKIMTHANYKKELDDLKKEAIGTKDRIKILVDEYKANEASRKKSENTNAKHFIENSEEYYNQYKAASATTPDVVTKRDENFQRLILRQKEIKKEIHDLVRQNRTTYITDLNILLKEMDDNLKKIKALLDQPAKNFTARANLIKTGSPIHTQFLANQLKKTTFNSKKNFYVNKKIPKKIAAQINIEKDAIEKIKTATANTKQNFNKKLEDEKNRFMEASKQIAKLVNPAFLIPIYIVGDFVEYKDALNSKKRGSITVADDVKQTFSIQPGTIIKNNKTKSGMFSVIGLGRASKFEPNTSAALDINIPLLDIKRKIDHI
jgi:hypothetical protein